MLLLWTAGCVSLPSQYAQLERKAADWDGDGFMDADDTDRAVADRHGLELGDCDDSNESVNPGMDELPYNGLDDDCDPASSDTDEDGDGFAAAEVSGTDCDDTDSSIFPGAEEVWYDGIDQDCSGGSDFDQDGDGHDAIEHAGTDCDDTDAFIGEPLPAFTDGDNDGVGGELAGEACTEGAGISFASGDCDDAEPLAYPGNSEVCDDGIDNDCSVETTCRWEGGPLDEHALRLDRETSDGFAIDVAVMRDLTFDGVSDLIIGAPEGDGGEGCVYVVEGGSRELEPAFVDCGFDGESGFGQYVGGGLDADDDGASDFLVADDARVFLFSGTTAEEIARFSGRTGDPEFVPSLNGGTTFDLAVSSADEHTGEVYIYEGGAVFWQGSYSVADAETTLIGVSKSFGTSIAVADVSGDGVPDLAVGDPEADGDATGSGVVYVFEGPVGFHGTPSDADMAWSGSGTGAAFGTSVRSDDANGDGQPDLLASAFSGGGNTVYVFSGGTVAASTDDAVATILGDTREDAVQRGMSIGDFDGDGSPDLAYGTPLHSDLASAAGGAFVAWGPLSGAMTSEVAFVGSVPGEHAGSDTRSTGDIDGDGTDDLIVSAARNRSATGAAYILFGQTE